MVVAAEIKSDIRIIRREILPTVDIGWLTLKDHFVATVGPTSGQGRPFGNLLVLADASIKPKSSFPMHPHKDMEILTWIVSGTLQHKDNIGTSAKINSQTVQFMSARDGIFHAEGNQEDLPLRLLQIWIKPNSSGGKAVFGVAAPEKPGFNLLAGPEKAPIILRQNVWLHVAILKNESQSMQIPTDKVGYGVAVHDLLVNGEKVHDGDGFILSPGRAEFTGTGHAVVIIQDNFWS